MDDADCFSPDYRTARARFRAAAGAFGAAIDALPVAATDRQGRPLDLTIDVAVLGVERPRRVVLVTSGLHGVEGIFGSAVQIAALEGPFAGWWPPAGTAIVLAHALNPFGFEQLRRANEDNVDLNRNFLAPGESYTGSPPGYAELDPLLNPSRPPGWDLFVPRLFWQSLRRGPRAVREAIAVGQYEFPRGLFFGGRGPSATHRLLAEHLPRWLGAADRVLHLDFHTGLGPSATHKLLTAHRDGDAATAALRGWFGPVVEAVHDGPTAYDNRGGIDVWLGRQFAGRDVYSVCAEFGTYPLLKVLSALRAENQAHHWAADDLATLARTKARLCEVFAPASRDWRRSVIRDSVALVRRAIEVCFAAPADKRIEGDVPFSR